VLPATTTLSAMIKRTGILQSLLDIHGVKSAVFLLAKKAGELHTVDATRRTSWWRGDELGPETRKRAL
jgi:hypothetical protein